MLGTHVVAGDALADAEVAADERFGAPLGVRREPSVEDDLGPILALGRGAVEVPPTLGEANIRLSVGEKMANNLTKLRS